ncbi:HNH endonuclease [Ensifer aridi]|uniref:HNH endonuclease n=1 Tax=Ensifer aridi TaxID=1708715 RepID=UPI000A117663|nr:HNH endonuclease [Ensifer aridi]
MSVIATALKHMLAAGMDPDAIVAAVAEMEREMAPAVERAAEKRREWDLERKRKLPNDWHQLRFMVIDRDACSCAYCGNIADPVHIDRIIPLSRGGTNDPPNLTVSCSSCNLEKAALTPDEWRAKACL